MHTNHKCDKHIVMCCSKRISEIKSNCSIFSTWTFCMQNEFENIKEKPDSVKHTWKNISVSDIIE